MNLPERRRFTSTGKRLEIRELAPASSGQVRAVAPSTFLLPREAGSSVLLYRDALGDPLQALGGKSPTRSGAPDTVCDPHSDGVLLAGDALGAALVPGLRVLLGPGAAAGHQALPAEAAAAARPVPFPRAPHPLVLRAPEGNVREGRRKMLPREPGEQRGGCFLSLLPSLRPAQLAHPVALGIFALL